MKARRSALVVGEVVFANGEIRLGGRCFEKAGMGSFSVRSSSFQVRVLPAWKAARTQGSILDRSSSWRSRKTRRWVLQLSLAVPALPTRGNPQQTGLPDAYRASDSAPHPPSC